MRKLLAVSMLLFLALAQTAMALPSDQTFSEATRQSQAKPPAGTPIPSLRATARPRPPSPAGRPASAGPAPGPQ